MNDIQIRNMTSFFFIYMFLSNMICILLLFKEKSIIISWTNVFTMMIILKDIYIRDKLLMYFMIYYQWLQTYCKYFVTYCVINNKKKTLCWKCSVWTCTKVDTCLSDVERRRVKHHPWAYKGMHPLTCPWGSARGAEMTFNTQFPRAPVESLFQPPLDRRY